MRVKAPRLLHQGLLSKRTPKDLEDEHFVLGRRICLA
jgi:hypothetical protein